MGFCSCSVFCSALLCVHSGFTIILMGREELAALVSLSSCVSWLLCCSSSRYHGVCLQFVILVFPGHTHYIKCASFAFNFLCYSYQTFYLSLSRISFFHVYIFLNMGGSRGGGGVAGDPDTPPPEKSHNYRVSWQYRSGSPEIQSKSGLSGTNYKDVK